ncbi:hypothetical protein [Microbispora sp. NPDC049125]|uniref:hypothetical protein n=1 Tax=Microbispora sp. NPDC049125 TaxID=3154929 RepID=UPI003466AAC4
MTAVISGLVAVVLLVLLVVALGMRSMNRRESALSADRLKAMAENKGPKPRRPAEETFFESFPAGFDAFEEPQERDAPKQRAGSSRPAPRPGGRQARPAQRGGKQPAAPRGKRGVDEWGEPDDYDDDYWSRVRADDGGFGGSIAARMATPRPLTTDPTGMPRGDSAKPPRTSPADAFAEAGDPDAATVQGHLPPRPAAAGLADLVEPVRPASAMAEQKTVTFSAPTPDVLGVLGTPAGAPSTGPIGSASTGPFDAGLPGGRSAGSSGSAASGGTGPFDAAPAGDLFATSPGPAAAPSGRSSRPGRSSRSASRRAAAASAEAQGRTSGSFPASASTGPFQASPSTGPFQASAATGPFDSPAGTGSYEIPGGTGAYEAPGGTGPFQASTGTGPFQASTGAGPFQASTGTGPFEATRTSTGSYASGSYDAGRTSGSFPAVTGAGPFDLPSTPPVDALGSVSPAGDPLAPRTDSFDPWSAYEAPRGTTGPFRAADTGSSYAVTPPADLPASPAPVGEPEWPAASGSYPAASSSSPSWPSHDVLDDPEPPRGASSWPNAETYQTPAYEDYSAGYSAGGHTYGSAPASPAPPPSPSSSYEVSAGWATIDESDTVTGRGSGPGTPAGPPPAVSPYESAGYDVPSGQSTYGYDQQPGYGAGTGGHPSLPEQNTSGSWPSYDELYGDEASQAAAARRGSHRNPETDYPDYYR